MRVVISLVLAIFFSLPVFGAIQATYYVSTEGDDSNPGSFAQPFATMEKARDVVRTINSSMTGDIEVIFMPGRYYINSTVEFNESDSGSNGYDVIYKSYDGPGSAFFIGGQVVSGWQQHSGQIYKTVIPGADFSTLYVNGKRAIKARTPNRVYDPDFPVAYGPYLLSDSGSTYDDLYYQSGDLNPLSWGYPYNDAEIVIWSGGYRDWFSDTIPINFVDTGSRRIYLTEEARYRIYDGGGSRYFVQGILALLDEPGEYHFDSGTDTLYYWSKTGDINTDEVIVPSVKVIISVKGSSQSTRVSNLKFEGLRLEYTDFTDWYRHAYPRDGESGEGHMYPQYDRQMTMPQHRKGLFYLENTDHVTIKDCYISNTGYSAIYCFGYNQFDTFTGNYLKHLGHSGVQLEGPYPGEGDVLNNNTISNTMISYIGELAGQAGGVNIMNSSNNVLTNLDISDGTRYAVLLAAYSNIPINDIYLQDNQIQNIAISRLCQDSGDAGAINCFGISDDLPYLNNYFENITIDDIKTNPQITEGLLQYPNAIFTDADTFKQYFTNIHVTNMQDAAEFRINLSGEHVYDNVSWRSGFNSSLIDYSQIGLQNDFVYSLMPPDITACCYNGREILIEWSNVDSASTYEIYRSQGTSNNFIKIAEGVNTLCFVDRDVIVPETYYYYLKSVSEGGVSSEASGTQTAITFNYPDIFESFENGLVGWDLVRGNPTVSSATARDGAFSFHVNEDTDVITKDFGQYYNGKVDIWFYDVTSYQNVTCFARVDNDAWDTPNADWVAVGLNTSVSTTKYCYREAANSIATNITRSTGWHKFTWDYSSGNNVRVYIDDQLILQSSIASTFRYISLGDWWGNGTIGQFLFDKIETHKKLMGDWDGDMKVDIYDLKMLADYWLGPISYESGFGNDCYRSDIVDLYDLSEMSLEWTD